jgi:hypothetical protein
MNEESMKKAVEVGNFSLYNLRELAALWRFAVEHEAEPAVVEKIVEQIVYLMLH